MRTYGAHIQFDPLWISVKARNKKEARKKVVAKIVKRSMVRQIDRQNFFIDEQQT